MVIGFESWRWIRGITVAVGITAVGVALAGGVVVLTMYRRGLHAQGR